MSFLVDTDVCSAHLKGQGAVVNRFIQYGGQLYLSTVTVGELYTWVFRARSAPRHLIGLLDLLRDVHVLDVNQDISRKFGEINAHLLDHGQSRGGMDLLIAATALVHGLTLVTHNTRDFSDVPGLAFTDWLNP